MNRSLFKLLTVLVLCALLGGYVTCADEKQGVIYINSDPVGADIFLKSASSSVDGLSSSADGLSVEDLIGITPLQFSVEPGVYKIVLQKYGYISWWTDEPITVGTENILDLGTIVLTPQEAVYGALHIETDPADATIELTYVRERPHDPAGIVNPEIPEIESKVYGRTPLSLESLPPGDYYYTIEKEGYEKVTEHPINVKEGRVSEVSVALTQIPTTEPVRFNSLPVGAEIYIIPKDYPGLDLETLDADAIKAEANYVGYIGYTPTTFEMPEGEWRYLMLKDSYYKEFGDFFVIVGTPVPDINRQLAPLPQSIEVYFESELDGVTAHYVTSHYGGEEEETNTALVPGWVQLPAEDITAVTFTKDFHEPLTINVDTTLFKGRPSKWGTPIALVQSVYTITSQADEHSTIDPLGPEPVLAGGCAPMYTITADSPDYQIKVPDGIKLSDKLSDTPIPNMVIEPYTDKKVLNENGCTNDSDIRVTVDNMVLSVESEQKEYTIGVSVGAGGTVKVGGDTDFVPALSGDFVSVLSGDDSPEFFFTPNEGYVLEMVLMDGREQRLKAENGPYVFEKVRANYKIEAEFRQTHITITPMGDTTQGSMSQTEVYSIPYGGCTKLHELIPAEGYDGRFDVYSTHTGSPFVETEAINPHQFQACGIKEDLTVEARFSPFFFNVNAVVNGNGSISPSGEILKEYMSIQEFELIPDPDNSLLKVLDNGVDVGTTSPYVLSNIAEDHTIEAVFTGADDYLMISPQSNAGGTIDPSEPQFVQRGEDVSFTITADECYTIGSIVINEIEERAAQSPRTIPFENVQVSQDMTVRFDRKEYTIDVTQSPGGMIEPAGLVSVPCEDSVNFTITADAGNAVQSLIVDDIEIAGEPTHLFVSVTEDHTLSARFIGPPEPDFLPDLMRAPPNYPVKFHDFTKNSPNDVLWDFGDGEVSREREPTHYYSSTGIYTVRLTAFNAASKTGVSITKDITITTDPIAKFSVEPEIGMTPPGFTVNMTNLSLNAETKDKVTFAWDFGDGKGSSIGRNPSYTYTAPGVYKVGLKVEKPYIAADYYYQTITILQEPVADFSAHPVSGLAPLAVQFEDKSQGFPTSWFWTFGDNTGSYDVSPKHIYAEPGSYTVTLSIESDEGSDTKIMEDLITVMEILP